MPAATLAVVMQLLCIVCRRSSLECSGDEIVAAAGVGLVAAGSGNMGLVPASVLMNTTVKQFCNGYAFYCPIEQTYVQPSA